jgi:VWFA-related protein
MQPPRADRTKIDACRHFGRSCLRVGLWSIAVVGLGAQSQPQTPVFRSSIEVTTVDVGVVDRDGKPIVDLAPSDFSVQVDGAPRRVVTAEWVSLVTPAKPDAPPPPPGYSTNENATGGRLILIVIDQPNIRFGGAAGLRRAVNTFIDRLQPSDRIAAVGIGPGSNSTPFTSNREMVKTAIARMPGARMTPPTFDLNIAISEALSIRDGDSYVTERVLRRECGEPAPNGAFSFDQEMCRARAEGTALAVAQSGLADTDITIGQLRALLMALRTIDLPKTMVIVTEGFLTDDQQPSMIELGNLAIQARTSIYALKLDDDLFDITRSGIQTAPFADRLARAEGIETVTGAARGTLFNIGTGAESAFARIESELAGYYLLGLESSPADKDGKRHPIKVSVGRPGVSIRSRSQLIMPAGSGEPRGPRESAMTALASPLIVSGLPLQVATFSLRGPDPNKIQLLIHAAVGADYSSSRVVSFGYVITDGEGRIVESLGGDTRIAPVMNGVPSPLQYKMGASVPPGDYTLKLSVAEGDRVGTVEHPVHAALVDAPPVHLSELMVGGPIPSSVAPEQPTVGHTVTFGGVHGYVEAYGTGSNDLKAQYEIAPDGESPAVLKAEVAGRPAGPERTIFSNVLTVRQLPPGKYVLRATVASDAGPIKTLVRDFEVARPPVLMTSTSSTGAGALASAEVYLPVIETQFARAFRREDATRPDVLRPFRDRIAPELQSTFDAGVASLSAGDYLKAETTLKSLADGDADSAAVLAYLAATFAASGHDQEAASAWQTALIDGSEFPDIYGWLGDTLLRIHDLGQARTILEEAVAKWPADVRFMKPLALMYATFGQGREAVRALERHLSAHPDDIESTYMALEWIYHLNLAGTSAQTKAEDVKVARGYAARYERAKGPQLPLVKQWLEYLEGRRR